MDNNISNMDEVFKNAFQNAEAPHTPAEMHADWNNVLNHIPHAPAQSPAPHNVAGQVGSGIGKIIGFSGLGAAVVATTVILYNIYVSKPVQKPAETKTSTEIQVLGQNKSIENSKDNSQVLNPGTDAKSAFNNKSNPSAQKTYKTESDKSDFQNKPGQQFANTVNPNQVPNPISKTTGKTTIPPVQPNFATAKLVLSDTMVCVNQNIGASTNATTSDNIINWGDGFENQLTGASVHAYSRTGSYLLTATGSSLNVERIIYVIEKPKARYATHHGNGLQYSFVNRSIQANKFVWTFGDGTEEEFGYNAVHTFKDTGKYVVRLRAINSAGCSDSFVQHVNVNAFAAPKVSTNAITLNGDHINDDVFVTVPDEVSFTFTIVDHTGQIVFQTSDKNKHWNGKNQNNGSDCPAGVYYYSISYYSKQNSEPSLDRGNITLIR